MQEELSVRLSVYTGNSQNQSLYNKGAFVLRIPVVCAPEVSM